MYLTYTERVTKVLIQDARLSMIDFSKDKGRVRAKANLRRQ